MAKEQAFLPNGAMANAAFDRDDFSNHPGYMMGTAHIWVWRRTHDGSIEVMLQQRSRMKKLHPGMLSVSAAGHIDEGETNLEAAVREFGEELGIPIKPEDLSFVLTLRKTNTSNVIASIYLYEADESFSPVFQDGEVEAIFWKPLDEFVDMTRNLEEHNLVNQGSDYFTVLIERLRLL